MADRIIANTEAYESLIVRLNRLTNQLNSCLAALNRVHTGQYGSVGMRLSGGKLQSTGALLSGSSVSASLDSLRNAVISLIDRTERLSRSVSKVLELFASNERGLVNLYGSADGTNTRAANTSKGSGHPVLMRGGLLHMILGGQDIASWDPARPGEYNTAGYEGSSPVGDIGSLSDLIREAGDCIGRLQTELTVAIGTCVMIDIASVAVPGGPAFDVSGPVALTQGASDTAIGITITDTYEMLDGIGIQSEENGTTYELPA